MPQIFGSLISAKMVSLRELQEYYTYDDCLDLIDILYTDNYNVRIIQENNREK